MSDPDISSRMREDWNSRAREDAGYYVAFGRREQSDAEFFATATNIINEIEAELRRVPAAQKGSWRALEVGCGPGRLMRPLSRHFLEIHGADVSDEMTGRAKENLRDIPNAHLHLTDGVSLQQFADESFDFVYSYAVFQHIPSRDVVMDYLREIHRVTKTGGLIRLQFNGMAGSEGSYDTWSGTRIGSTDLLDFAERHDLQVLALSGVGTQYTWTTWRKQPVGWFRDRVRAAEELASAPEDPPPSARIRRITNASGSEPVAPCRGRFASIFLWVEGLPEDAELHHLRVTVGSSLGSIIYIGPKEASGLQQVSVILPELEATGLLPVELLWLGRRISYPATLRVIPPGPSIPQIISVSDAVNLCAQRIVETRMVKMTLEEVARPHEMEVRIGGHSVADLELVCTDPRPQRFEVNFRLPEEVGPGTHVLELRIGRRTLPPVVLNVIAPEAAV